MPCYRTQEEYDKCIIVIKISSRQQIRNSVNSCVSKLQKYLVQMALIWHGSCFCPDISPSKSSQSKAANLTVWNTCLELDSGTGAASLK